MYFADGLCRSFVPEQGHGCEDELCLAEKSTIRSVLVPIVGLEGVRWLRMFADPIFRIQPA